MNHRIGDRRFLFAWHAIRAATQPAPEATTWRVAGVRWSRVSGGENPRIDGDVAGCGLSSFCGEGAVVLAPVKDARRRFAVALRPSLTAAAHVSGRCAGRDDGMAVLIEQQDDFWSGSVAISTDLAGWRGSGRGMIWGRVVSILPTGCALLAKQIL
jgi:hypothetical protein